MIRFAIPLLMLVAAAQARPFYGSFNCLSCHTGGTFNDGRLTLLNPDDTLNPLERPGALDRGPLPVIRMLPGQSRTLGLQVDVLGEGVYFDVVFHNDFQKPGVVNGSTLTFEPDPAWTMRTNFAQSDVWYTAAPSNPHDPFPSDSVREFQFTLTLPAGVPADVYELEFGWAGAGGRDAGAIPFYLSVEVPEPAGWMSSLPLAAACFGRRPRRR